MLDILLADDEPSIRLIVGDALRDAGHQVTAAGDGAAALQALESRGFDVVITDMRMPQATGFDVLRAAKTAWPGIDVMVITAYGDVEDAVEALKSGACDYLLKPFDHDELLVRLARLAERRALEHELREARSALQEMPSERLIIGQAPCMVKLQQRVATIAKSDANVIVFGESGTGKELVVRTIHQLSGRVGRPFVAVNCAAFPETLLEAELFGHEKGAFTGAMRRRDGRFQAAHGGTLFLDEIAEIPPMAQAKLLRVLQEGVVEPLGSDRPVEVDVRVLSATHRDLKARIAAGLFREDLYYRLNVLDIHVPALRERRGDMALLVEHFVRRFSKNPQAQLRVTPRAWAALREYRFPGNVRELEHAVHHAVVFAGEGEIDVQHLPQDIVGNLEPVATTSDEPTMPALADALGEFERTYVVRVMRAVDGKRTEAAKILGISRKNLWEKMRHYGISDEELQAGGTAVGT